MVGVYDYAEVPQQAYDDLLKAKSIGGHFYKNIRNSFKATKRQADGPA